jgi:hypothetical protein
MLPRNIQILWTVPKVFGIWMPKDFFPPAGIPYSTRYWMSPIGCLGFGDREDGIK